MARPGVLRVRWQLGAVESQVRLGEDSSWITVPGRAS